MFAESLLESNVAGESATCRGWSTLVSLFAQAMLLAGLASISILRPVDLPSDLKSFHLPTVEPTVILLVSHPPSDPISKSTLSPVTPTIKVPLSPNIHYGPPTERADDASTPLLPGLAIGFSGTNPFTSVLAHSDANVTNSKTNEHPRRVSIFTEGQLLSRTQPVYPMAAKMAGIQGRVVLAAIISKAGLIESLQVKSGHPLLVPAALNAVKEWRYRPYVLNGEAIEVETQITVDFKLGR